MRLPKPKARARAIVCVIVTVCLRQLNLQRSASSSFSCQVYVTFRSPTFIPHLLVIIILGTSLRLIIDVNRLSFIRSLQYVGGFS